MKSNLIEKVRNLPLATFCAAVWRRELQTLKGVSDIVEKQTSAHSLTLGIYDNRATVQDKRESGELPAQNAGLNGMEWAEFPRLLRGVKSGKVCVRFNVTANTKFASVYFVNGKRVEKSVALALCRKQSASGKPLVVNVGLENLVAVRG